MSLCDIIKEKCIKAEKEKMYEKAIAGYQFHVTRYKDWMNMYAIFVGALFVGYYNIAASSFVECNNIILEFIILIVGLIASLSWLVSFQGYYTWMISWIRILHLHESEISAFKKCLITRVYSAYFTENIDGDFKGYSTQKITRFFIWIVVLAWSALLLHTTFFKNMDFENSTYIEKILSISSCLLLAFVIVVLITILLRMFLKKIEDNTNKRIINCLFIMSRTVCVIVLYLFLDKLILHYLLPNNYTQLFLQNCIIKLICIWIFIEISIYIAAKCFKSSTDNMYRIEKNSMGIYKTKDPNVYL